MVEINMTEFLNSLTPITSNLGFQIGILTAIITSIASAIIGFAIFLIKRVLNKKDFEHQQNIAHSLWLIKKLHNIAEKHYVILTRHLIYAEEAIKNAEIAHDNDILKTAYDRIKDLVKTYHKFEIDTGANILFIEREVENEVIGKIQSLFLSLPFDKQDYQNIKKDSDDRAKQSFENWIKSNHCPKSKELVKKRLSELRILFDDQTEKILHHEYFLKSRKKKHFSNFLRKKSQIPDDNFYIHKLTPKYVKKTEKVMIFGKGFQNENITFSLFLNDNSLEKTVKGDQLVEIIVPDAIPEGTYEITATFSHNKKEGDEPMGLVIHIIENQSSINQTDETGNNQE